MSTATNELAYNLGVQQLVPSLGIFNAALSWADTPDVNRVGSFFVQLQGFQALHHTVDVTLGDTFVVPSLLLEDRPRGQANFFFFPTLFPMVTNPYPLVRFEDRFSNFFPPSLSFQGGRIDVSSPSSHYVLFGGRVTTLTGFTGNIASVTDQQIMGGKLYQKIGDRLTLGLGFIRTSGSNLAFTNSHIQEDNTILSSIQYRVTPSLLMQGEYGFSRHTIVGSADQQRGTDSYWIAGPVYQTNHFSLDLNYQHIGTNFPLFQQLSQADREGVFLNTSFRSSPSFSLYGTFERFWNNLDHDSQMVTVDTTLGLLGATYVFPIGTLVALRGEATARASRETGRPGTIDVVTPAFQADVAQSFWAKYRGLLRYRRDYILDHLGPDSSADTLRGELSRTFKNFNLLVAEEIVRKVDTRGGDTSKSFTSIANLGYHAFSNLDGFLQFAWTRDLERDLSAPQNHYNVDGSLRLRLPFGFMFNLDLNYALAQSSSDTFHIAGHLSKTFGYGAVPPTSQLPLGVGRPAVPLIGTIEGYVLTQPGRQGVPNIRILLDDGTPLLTDAQGHYTFPRVWEGEHWVRLDLRKLPAAFALIGDPDQRVTVQARGLSRLDFPIAPLGRISGRVMNDANRNGQLDSDETGQAGVRVVAVLDQERTVTFTELDGTFLFDNLMRGSYTIQVDSASLPEGTTILPTSSLTIPLEPGGDVRDVLFLIHIPPRPVIKKEF